MTRIDYSQLIKEQVAPSLRLLEDKGEAICMHSLLKKLFFLSSFEAKEKPSDFSEHINLWSLDPLNKAFIHYCSILSVKYLWTADFPICSNRLKSIGLIQGLLYESLMYRQIESLGIDDKYNAEALHAKVSPLVRKVLEYLQQYLLANSRYIKKVYKASPFSYSEFVTDVLQSLHTTHDVTCNLAVGEFYSALFSIAKKLKSRSVGHFVNVISLCGTYPQSDFFLPLEDWIDSAVLEDIKLVNSLLKNSGETKSNQATIAVMYKTLETINSLCTVRLSETIVKYKKPSRAAVVSAANAKIFAEPNPEVSFQKRIAVTVGVAPSAVSPLDPDVQVRDNTELVIVRTAVDLENMPGAPSEQSAIPLQSPDGQGGGSKTDHNVHAIFQSVSRSKERSVKTGPLDILDAASVARRFR